MLLVTGLFLIFATQHALQIQPHELNAKGRTFSIHLVYPEIDNAPQFNATVHHILDEHVEQFRRNMPDELNPDFHEGSLEGHYTSAILKNGIVSVLLDLSIYSPGAAHPGAFQASVNYDSRTHRALGLRDVFRHGVNYVAVLSELAIASLQRDEYADIDQIRRGAGPVESNFKVFTLTETTLVLHFPQYQVAAGAAGNREVVIKLDRLSSSLRASLKFRRS